MAMSSSTVDPDQRSGAVPKVSVIILNWNGRELLGDCLASVLAQAFKGFEVILVDNGSTDGSAEWVATEYPQVRVLRLAENLGFCGGNNAGVRIARGEYLVLLNNDTVVEPDWLEPLYTTIVSDPRIAACDSKVLYSGARNTIWSAGASYTIAGTANFRAQGASEDALGPDPAEVFSAVACSAIYRRPVWDEIGGLDETFFAGYEDVDWSFRARLRGYRILNVPSSRVYHKVSATHGYNSPAYVRRGQRNVTATFLKNMPAPLLLRYAGLHLFYVIGSFLYFARVGRIGAFLLAKRDLVADWRAVWRSRADVQRRRTVSVRELEGMLSRDWLGAKARKFCG
jgi:GT2 family glycosyltransferase